MSKLPHLARQFDLQRKGAKQLDLGLWEDRFAELAQHARDGTVTADQLVELVAYDFETDQDGRAAARIYFEALLADATQKGLPT